MNKHVFLLNQDKLQIKIKTNCLNIAERVNSFRRCNLYRFEFGNKKSKVFLSLIND